MASPWLWIIAAVVLLQWRRSVVFIPLLKVEQSGTSKELTYHNHVVEFEICKLRWIFPKFELLIHYLFFIFIQMLLASTCLVVAQETSTQGDNIEIVIANVNNFKMNFSR